MAEGFELERLDTTMDLLALDCTRLVASGSQHIHDGFCPVLRFVSTARVAFVLTVEPADLHALLAPVERALAEWQHTLPDLRLDPTADQRTERWWRTGNLYFEPSRPSWIAAGLAEEPEPTGHDIAGRAVALTLEPRPEGQPWTLTVDTAQGLALNWTAELELVEELWNLLYDAWQALDPGAGAVI